MKFRGKVVEGAGRGKALGFPTANLDAKTDLEEGIYAAHATSPALRASSPRQGRRECIVFVGAAETFGETQKKVEVYVLDFDDNLYGQKLEVEILQKLRDNVKFGSKESLIAQMRRDESAARRFFEKQNR